MDRQKHSRKKKHTSWFCDFVITMRDKNADTDNSRLADVSPPTAAQYLAMVSPVSVFSCQRCTVPAFTFPLNLFPARHKNNGHLLFTAEVIKRWSSFLTFSSAVLYVRGIFRPRVTVTLCKVRQTGHIVTACQSEEIKFRIHLAYFAIHWKNPSKDI